MSIVSNFNIENAAGQTVRQDIEACFLALQSSNSSSADSDLASSACVAGMTFLNTTSNILKIRNSSNGGFTEIGNIDSAYNYLVGYYHTDNIKALHFTDGGPWHPEYQKVQHGEKWLSYLTSQEKEILQIEIENY